MSVWLNDLKQQYTVTLQGVSFRVCDFYTSNTPGVVATELEQDWHRVVKHPFKDGDKVLDLGANVGMWAFMVARLHPQVKIVCVEPMPHNAANLRLGIAINQLTNIEVVEKAVWAHQDTITLKQHPLNSGAASTHLPEANAPAFQVQCTTLRRLVDEYGPFAFTKVDIEGAEHDAFIDVPWEGMGTVSIELHHQFGWTQDEIKDRKEAFFQKYKDKAHFVDIDDGKSKN
jgi:FkbM family methyltransferase